MEDVGMPLHSRGERAAVVIAMRLADAAITARHRRYSWKRAGTTRHAHNGGTLAVNLEISWNQKARP